MTAQAVPFVKSSERVEHMEPQEGPGLPQGRQTAAQSSGAKAEPAAEETSWRFVISHAESQWFQTRSVSLQLSSGAPCKVIRLDATSPKKRLASRNRKLVMMESQRARCGDRQGYEIILTGCLLMTPSLKTEERVMRAER